MQTIPRTLKSSLIFHVSVYRRLTTCQKSSQLSEVRRRKKKEEEEAMCEKRDNRHVVIPKRASFPGFPGKSRSRPFCQDGWIFMEMAPPCPPWMVVVPASCYSRSFGFSRVLCGRRGRTFFWHHYYSFDTVSVCVGVEWSAVRKVRGSIPGWPLERVREREGGVGRVCCFELGRLSKSGILNANETQ